MLRIFALAALVLLAAQPAQAQYDIESELVQTGPNEQALRQVLIVNTDRETAWRFFTDADLLRRWIAPVAEADVRTGGAIRTNYDACAAIGDEGTITLHIVNFVPQEILTLQASLDNQRDAAWMTDAIWARRDALYEMIVFEEMEDGRTRITSWGLGYGTGEDWEAILGFFIAGNEWTYDQLQRAVTGEEMFAACDAGG